MLKHLTEQGVTDRLQLVLVDRGVTEATARKLGSDYDLGLRRVGWDDKQPVFPRIRHAWRVEVAHGRLGRARRLGKSFENTTTSATGWLQVACIATTLPHRDHVAHLRGLRDVVEAGCWPEVLIVATKARSSARPISGHERSGD
jgi:hypothetical protein